MDDPGRVRLDFRDLDRRPRAPLAASGAVTALALAGLSWVSAVAPALSPLALAAGAVLGWRRREWTRRVPLRPAPAVGEAGAGRPGGRAEGMFFLGHEEDGAEIWASRHDITGHSLVLGEAGAGRRELLLGLAANALACGGGFAMVDASGGVSGFKDAFLLCERFGRTKDLVCLNFVAPPHEGAPNSLRFNPFATGSAAGLVGLLAALMDDRGGMDRGGAIVLLEAVLGALCWLRDREGLALDAAVLWDHLALDNVLALGEDDRLPPAMRAGIERILAGIPGFQIGRGTRQSETALHRFERMVAQPLIALRPLCTTYGHVFCGGGTDVDFADVVANRRVLVVLLPALERSGEEVANLGKIVIQCLKSTLAGALERGGGEDAADRWRAVDPCRDRPPYLVMLDGVGRYAAEGTAMLAAQGRALGVGFVFAQNNLHDLGAVDAKEAASIVASTGTKMCMRSNEGAPSPWADRVSPGCLFSLRAGEAVILHSGRALRAQTFYAGNLRPRREDGWPKPRLPDLISLDAEEDAVPEGVVR